MTDFVKKSSRGAKNDGSYIFSNFSEGLYLLDTPRGFGEQLGNLALLGGRNVWSEKGSLIPQYGYMPKAQIPETDSILAVTKDDKAAATFFIVCRSGDVYLYTAAQGLKKYKTQLDMTTLTSECLVTRSNKTMIISDSGQHWMFGSFFDEADVVQITTDVEVKDYSAYFQFTVPIDDLDYYWIGKELCVNSEDKLTVTYASKNIDDTTATIRAVPDFDTDRPVYSTTVNVGEKTLLSVDFIYKHEEESIEDIVINPQFMEVVTNRLCIVDTSGYIYYSALGVLDNFEETSNAGYFGGFYNDNSNVLALDDYLDGVLITKQNGLYYLTINNTTSSSSVSSESSIGISVSKLAEIGQQYAQDHVVVRDKVYAYDSNTCSIVLAGYKNSLGSIQQGNILVTSETLNAQDLGITESERKLTYNCEANCMILYYGEGFNNGLVLTVFGSLFPRELDRQFDYFIKFNQGVAGITSDGLIVQDFKKGTIILNKTATAEFEAIGLKDNRCICSSIIEVTELNGIEYDITTTNAITSFQHIKPYTNFGIDKSELPPLIYSDYKNNIIMDSFELTTKWAEKKSNLTRVYAPMSGRNGVAITFEFPENVAFCLAAIRLVDFSQGE